MEYETRARDFADSAAWEWEMGAEAFERCMLHHSGIRALWETKWKVPCEQGVYPFHDGAYEDFAPIFEHLIQHSVNDPWSDAYTQAFVPIAKALEKQGAQAVAAGDKQRASSIYLRAAAVLRIARFPYITQFPTINNTGKWQVWEEQKRIYRLAGKLWEHPLREIKIPYNLRGASGWEIPVYVRVPSVSGKAPVVILLTGLDGYRPDNTVRCNEFLRRGWAVVVVEIPGTADCPVDLAAGGRANTPESLWDNVLSWMQTQTTFAFDMAKVLIWGLSAGGYYAARLAFTHHDRLLGVVAQGMGCHLFFDPEWLDKADGHEYPFLLTPCLARKYGFSAVETFKRDAKTKFSLIETGIVKQPCTRLLLVNGTQDGLMPVEDSRILLYYGAPKTEARLFPGALHMGYPMANSAVYEWLESVVAEGS